MREFMDIVSEAARHPSSERGYLYLGNCTNSFMAPYLEDMMDAAVEVPYRVFTVGVDPEELRATFPDYDWSRRPKYLTLRGDAYVTYYRSTFVGSPCLYARHSGIEYVFVPPGFDLQDEEEHQQRSDSSLYVSDDGNVTTISSGRDIFSIYKIGNRMEVTCSRAPTKEAAAGIEAIVRDQTPGTVIIDDGDEKTPEEFIADLRDWVSRVTAP